MVFHRFLHSYSWVLIPLSSVDMPASESAGPVDVVIGLPREGQPAPPSSIRTFEAEVNKRPACPLEPEKRTVCKRPSPASQLCPYAVHAISIPEACCAR